MTDHRAIVLNTPLLLITLIARHKQRFRAGMEEAGLDVVEALDILVAQTKAKTPPLVRLDTHLTDAKAAAFREALGRFLDETPMTDLITLSQACAASNADCQLLTCGT